MPNRTSRRNNKPDDNEWNFLKTDALAKAYALKIKRVRQLPDRVRSGALAAKRRPRALHHVELRTRHLDSRAFRQTNVIFHTMMNCAG